VEIVGVPDFLLPARRGYAIRDSKLSRRLVNHTEIELQLQLYGWLYEETYATSPNASWRRKPVTNLQKAVLVRMAVDNAVIADMTRGEASALIGERFKQDPIARRASIRAARRRRRGLRS